MINQITFRNFKCLDGKTFDFSKINLFAGYNGRGKSSVLQSLLMLSQSVHASKVGSGFERLHLTGNLVYLGTYDEILTDDKNTEVGFDIKTSDSQCSSVQLSYDWSEDDLLIGNIRSCVINDIDMFASVGMKGDSINKESKLTGTIPQSLTNLFKYLYFTSADRQGPIKFAERQEIPEFKAVGSKGALTINMIVSYKDLIDASMNLRGNDLAEHNLPEIVSEWISYIMDGGTIDVDGKDDKKRSVYSLGFSMDTGKPHRLYNSYNVGYGYSYVLSVVVTAMIARKDSIVIIENPEAHLHPEAQSRLTFLLSKLAARDVQVFVETHSEHIVNGFRLAALRDSCPIENDDLAIYFFDRNFSIKKLEISPDGRIKEWPEGFFDQASNDLAEIIRLGIKNRNKYAGENVSSSK